MFAIEYVYLNQVLGKDTAVPVHFMRMYGGEDVAFVVLNLDTM